MIRSKEDYYQAHKREFAEKAIMPKWNPASKYGRELLRYPVDRNHYRAKSLLPLDAKPFQEQPFLRTAKKGWHFQAATASII